MNTAPAVLPRTLELVDWILSRPQLTLAFNSDDDPLAINLPPLGGGNGSPAIDRETMEVMAALYFQSELEQAGVIPVAEVLTEARFQLQLRDPDAAQRIEMFAQQMQREFYPRRLREQLFARTFGTGAGASTEAGMTVNREFETRFAQLCVSLERYQVDARWGPPTSEASVRVEMSMKTLLMNLARRKFGNTLVATGRIQLQLKAALELLNHRGVTTLFQARNVWGVIRGILGPDTPDLARFIDRAQTGLRILTWIGMRVSDIRSGSIAGALARESSLFMWASTWLRASGYTDPRQQLAPQPPGTGPSGYGQIGYKQQPAFGHQVSTAQPACAPPLVDAIGEWKG
jgi:hypothetical protein